MTKKLPLYTERDSIYTGYQSCRIKNFLNYKNVNLLVFVIIHWNEFKLHESHLTFNVLTTVYILFNVQESFFYIKPIIGE